jgi:hypothetical protein
VARGWIHTVRKNGSWVNEVEEGPTLSTDSTKDAAVAAGRDEAKARKTEHVIHNMDGSIAERYSDGNDPFPPPG